MKRRNDSGFTLIELMIVIAVIGILAIVLVPKIGTVKTQAKETGLDTNVRLVQGYVESKIDKWVSKSLDKADVEADIENAFQFTDTAKQLMNPISSTPYDAQSGDAADADGSMSLYIATSGDEGDVTVAAKGVVVVVVDGDYDENGISIYAFGANGTLLTEKTVTIKP